MTPGFVYLMGNVSMPDIYKIGTTRREPDLRAYELSAPTSIPTPFELMCVTQLPEACAFERRMHTFFGENRVSATREFFAFKGECAWDTVHFAIFQLMRLNALMFEVRPEADKFLARHTPRESHKTLMAAFLKATRA